MKARRSLLRFSAFALLISAVACGGKSKPVGETESRSATAASAEPKAAVLPDAIPELLAAVPASATLVANVPRMELSESQKALYETALSQGLGELASQTGIAEAALKAALESFDGATLFLNGSANSWSEGAGSLDAAVVARFKDEKSFESLAASFEDLGKGRYKIKRGELELHVVWLAKQKVAIVATKTESIEAVLATLTGEKPAFSTTVHGKEAAQDKAFVFADLHRIALDETMFAEGSFATILMNGDSAEFNFKQYGDKVPRLSTVLSPTSHEAMNKLPESPLMALDLGLSRQPGKGLPDFFAEIARASGSDATPQANQLAAAVGLSLSDIERALGDGFTLGLYSMGGAPNPMNPMEQIGVVALLDIKDDAVAKTLLDVAKKSNPGQGVSFLPNGVKFDVQGKLGGSLMLEPGRAVLVAGSPATAALLQKKMKSGATLGQDGNYKLYLTGATPSLLRIFTDFASMAALSGGQLPVAGLPGASGSDVVLGATDKGVEISVKSGLAAVSVIGTMSALGIFGVRRYLANAKVSEAKNSVGAITRGAVSAYEREPAAGGHALCKSAIQAPATVPSGTKVLPSSEPGKDFDSGDDTSGWRCLKFTMASSLYYAYDYRAGGGYKCVARGGKDPGPNGFEVSAEGDLDADGKTSLFCMTGTIDAATNSVRVDPTMFVVDEFE